MLKRQPELALLQPLYMHLAALLTTRSFAFAAEGAEEGASDGCWLVPLLDMLNCRRPFNVDRDTRGGAMELTALRDIAAGEARGDRPGPEGGRCAGP